MSDHGSVPTPDEREMRCAYYPPILIGWTLFGVLVTALVFLFTVGSDVSIPPAAFIVLIVGAFAVVVGLLIPLAARLRGIAIVLDEKCLTLPQPGLRVRSLRIPVSDLRRARADDHTLRIEHDTGYQDWKLSELERDRVSVLTDRINQAASEAALGAWLALEDEDSDVDATQLRWERVPPELDWIPVRTVDSIAELPAGARAQLRNDREG